jgi:phosphatidylserine decarboxylase
LAAELKTLGIFLETFTAQGHQPISLKKGEEMGRFSLGSTVILLFPEETIAFNPKWSGENSIRMGEYMGDVPD